MLSEMVPCAAMVVVEGCIIALTIMASTAIARGMSPFVVTIGQNVAFVGLSYSSPIVACGMANQMPAFSFILAIILRTTKLNWKRSGSQARFIGTLISLGGAISLALYKGPTIRNHSSLTLPPRLLVFTSTHENWVLGCILFAASSFVLAIWNVMQICPQVWKIISFYSLFGTVQSAAVALYFERDPNAWKLDLNFELLIIILTGIFSSLIRTNVQMWCTRLKGPIFVPLFKPCGIAYASTFGSLLFADTFHYGSIMGACICGVGYYTVLWGQIKDEEMNKSDGGKKIITSTSSTDEKVPLLEQDSHV
ncbi:hypothetical protein C2S52_015556 [Perilla frutescens var. hirtella]|nr:hypothetical protein C2S52_015556 [Perilla frutescens var. hirtella]